VFITIRTDEMNTPELKRVIGSVGWCGSGFGLCHRVEDLDLFWPSYSILFR